MSTDAVATSDAARVVATMTGRSLSLATAESLTGGLLGATLTSVPGASRCFLGSVTAYDSRMKTALLGVDKRVIGEQTVVSEAVALAMAIGVQDRTDADWVIAVTGVAGPDPQDGHEPGEVWICVQGPRIASLPQFSQVQQFWFTGDREAIRTATVDAALAMLLRVVSPV